MLRVSLIGNLGADPEMRFTAKGTGMVTFRVAVNSVRLGPEGERQENTEWFRVRMARSGQEWATRLAKGMRVLVIGRLDIGRYQTREGETRTSFDVWADEIQTLGARTLAPGQPDGVMESAPEAAEPAEPVTAGVSSLTPRAERPGNQSNGKARAADRTATATRASTEAADLEDLPF